MKREEIRARAEGLVKDLGLPVHNSRTLTVERHMETIVRATLEEAARAMCRRCAEGQPITYTHSTATPSLSRRMHKTYDSWCKANAIHDLIAALKEGE